MGQSVPLLTAFTGLIRTRNTLNEMIENDKKIDDLLNKFKLEKDEDVKK